MKTIFILLIALSTFTTGFNNTQETTTKTIEATFHSAQGGKIYFTIGAKKMAFHGVETEVDKKVDLSSESIKGKSYKITYDEGEFPSEGGGKVQTFRFIKNLEAI